MSDVTGYMCLTDFRYELGKNYRGNTIYPSVEALRAFQKCCDECGIVKVKISLTEVIQEENFSVCYTDNEIGLGYN